VKVISSQAAGAPDIFWFAKIAGPVASMQDLHGQAVSFSTRGSLSTTSSFARSYRRLASTTLG
jgi:hypothetical protein